jgi:hypothetical protein
MKSRQFTKLVVADLATYLDDNKNKNIDIDDDDDHHHRYEHCTQHS